MDVVDAEEEPVGFVAAPSPEPAALVDELDDPELEVVEAVDERRESVL
ncbi:MAG TPA: hypothetical protein VFK93_00720 [Candidatus Limnocylindria bacterium]|nr:hypothetical protein [Candidatus Limnocylindria bacterium]